MVGLSTKVVGPCARRVCARACVRVRMWGIWWLAYVVGLSPRMVGLCPTLSVYEALTHACVSVRT